MVVYMKCKNVRIDKIDISERIDIDKTNKSKECDIYCYWYFSDKNLN